MSPINTGAVNFTDNSLANVPNPGSLVPRTVANNPIAMGPCAILRLNMVFLAYSSFICSGLKSPHSPA